MREKQQVVYASSITKKYYFDPAFDDIPRDIKRELIDEAVKISQKVYGVISIGFFDDGNIFIEEQKDDVFVDDIGLELEIRQFEKEKAELLKALTLWYKIYRTADGEKVKEALLKNRGNANEV
ncbi:MAG: hypothetical protein ATN35_03575 [Epulopiscium sp. Nele67-Bin004]|nr:MAG: hypothetical protein ATN35_03575 [Epulopiscium sp. Nele67-Bin004]